MSSEVNYPELTHAIAQHLAALRADVPEVMQAFNDLGRAASRDGCLGFHAQALAKLGAGKQEAEEALAMAVYMGGDPSLMYSAHALAAFEPFSAKTA